MEEFRSDCNQFEVTDRFSNEPSFRKLSNEDKKKIILNEFDEFEDESVWEDPKDTPLPTLPFTNTMKKPSVVNGSSHMKSHLSSGIHNTVYDSYLRQLKKNYNPLNQCFDQTASNRETVFATEVPVNVQSEREKTEEKINENSEKMRQNDIECQDWLRLNSSKSQSRSAALPNEFQLPCDRFSLELGQFQVAAAQEAERKQSLIQASESTTSLSPSIVLVTPKKVQQPSQCIQDFDSNISNYQKEKEKLQQHINLTTPSLSSGTSPFPLNGFESTTSENTTNSKTNLMTPVKLSFQKNDTCSIEQQPTLVTQMSIVKQRINTESTAATNSILSHQLSTQHSQHSNGHSNLSIPIPTANLTQQNSQSCSSPPLIPYQDIYQNNQVSSINPSISLTTKPSETLWMLTNEPVGDQDIKRVREALTGMSSIQRIKEEVALLQHQAKLIERKKGPFYVIERKWMESYIIFLKDMNRNQGQNYYNNSPPITFKPIMNLSLADQHQKTQLRANVQFGVDFEIVSKNHFLCLNELYGGGPAIIFPEKLFSRTQDPIERQFQSLITEHSQSSDSGFLLHPKNVLQHKSLEVRGLHNQSNYCYLNSVLQVFLSISELNYYCISEQSRLVPRVKGEKKLRMHDVFVDLCKLYAKTTVGKIIDAELIKKAIQKPFTPHSQQDAQELLRYILSEIQDELNPSKSYLQKGLTPAEIIKQQQLAQQVCSDSEGAYKNFLYWQNSIIDVLFAGQIQSEVHCGLCGNISHTFDPFLDLSLAIDTVGTATLQDCLVKFFAEEQLTDAYKCEKCLKYARAKKQVSISKTPYILAMHLKRFQTYPKKKKLTNFIKFSEDLSIKPFLKGRAPGSSSYNLFGVIVHSGTQDSGHYTAFVRRENKWFYCNDSNVQEVSEKIVLKQESYLLFYQRTESSITTQRVTDNHISNSSKFSTAAVQQKSRQSSLVK